MADHRQRFSAADGIYLLSHSVGRMPLDIEQHLAQSYFHAWQTHTPDPWGEWLQAIDGFKGSLATFLNAQTEEFCPQTNLSSGLFKLLGALPKSNLRNTILVSENDFPSMGFVAQQASRLGLSLRWLPKNFCYTDAQAWQQVLDDDLLAVLITHVHYNTNTQVPVAEITTHARNKGVFSIVDVAQSIGVVPIDLSQWQADAVLGSCVKWLCGGPGAGFLWVASKSLEGLKPADVGWFSHENPFEFDIHHFEYASTADRFWGGTPSVLPFDTARYSIDLMNSIGIDEVLRHNRALADILIAAIPPDALVTPRVSEHRGGTLVVKFPQQELVEERLNKQGVFYDARAYGIRLSPHIYNTAQEMQRVAECLSQD